MHIPTIAIKVPPGPGNPEGKVLINAYDFDPTKHEPYDEPPKGQAAGSAGTLSGGHATGPAEQAGSQGKKKGK